MKVKLTFDDSVPVDDLPDAIVVEAETLKAAFAAICDKIDANLNYWPLDAVGSVKILGKGGRDVTDEFNEFWEEY